mmetsp:Transcript_15046/g.37472  ORF Transcript_15046/g.37472 Transcript_15046/m.37472 type:complete len:204 (+) Transcript_15046:966-1577(+)
MSSAKPRPSAPPPAPRCPRNPRSSPITVASICGGPKKLPCSGKWFMKSDTSRPFGPRPRAVVVAPLVRVTVFVPSGSTSVTVRVPSDSVRMLRLFAPRGVIITSSSSETTFATPPRDNGIPPPFVEPTTISTPLPPLPNGPPGSFGAPKPPSSPPPNSPRSMGGIIAWIGFGMPNPRTLDAVTTCGEEEPLLLGFGTRSDCRY